jgi:hypothetical protein
MLALLTNLLDSVRATLSKNAPNGTSLSESSSSAIAVMIVMLAAMADLRFVAERLVVNWELSEYVV